MDTPKEGPRISVAELKELLKQTYPQSAGIGEIESLGARSARARHKFSDADLRPGGTVSGPVMMALADFTFYAALLASIGVKPLAVTTGLNINFLRKPTAADLIAEAEILRLGRRLAIGDVKIFSDGQPRPVAHAMVTYSLPQEGT